MLDLPFTNSIQEEMKTLFDRVQKFVSPIEWAILAPKIKAIIDLKKERNAVILAHNYQVPEIFHCIADFVGDSLGLAIEASKTQADVIVQCGVLFMAETSKVLNPCKIVLIPDNKAGCSLANSITGDDVDHLRKLYPDLPIVAYVNTSAEVKAKVDICCTSANAVKIVESLDAPEVIFLPDRYLAQNVAAQTDVKLIAWHGSCEVHELFTRKDIDEYQKSFPDVVVLAHPECKPEVVRASDFSGSTAGMIRFIREKKPKKVFLVTECSMSNNVSAMTPGVEFVRPCHLCPHMQLITLDKILCSLRDMKDVVEVKEQWIKPARRSIERMMAVH